MGIIVGIDVGGSTTKIVGFDQNKNMIQPLTVKANDPVASSYGAFGKFAEENGIAIDEIERIYMTGVGSSFTENGLFSIPTEHVTEFHAIGLGGLYLSDLSEAIIVSLGTGTAIVHANKSGTIEYMGGTGVGGGTLIGLSKKLLGLSHVSHIVELARDGNVENIDLRISDITKKDILPGLSTDMTASNFGKVSEVATRSDIALGLFNLIFESVGMLAIFAARARALKDIVLIGNLSQVPQASMTFGVLNDMFSMHFILPEKREYATVIGAALKHFERHSGCGCGGM